MSISTRRPSWNWSPQSTSGRGFFNNVVVVQQHDGRFDWSEIKNNGHSIQDLPSYLVDADGDGAPELILERFLDRYEGAQRAPVETVVYRWQHKGFKDDSDAFPQYYREKVIPDLESRLAKNNSAPSSSPTRHDDEAFMLRTELARAKKRGRIK